jgi:hypothetical protein
MKAFQIGRLTKCFNTVTSHSFVRCPKANLAPLHFSVMGGHHVCTRSSDTVNKALGGRTRLQLSDSTLPFYIRFQRQGLCRSHEP